MGNTLHSKFGLSIHHVHRLQKCMEKHKHQSRVVVIGKLDQDFNLRKQHKPQTNRELQSRC